MWFSISHVNILNYLKVNKRTNVTGSIVKSMSTVREVLPFTVRFRCMVRKFSRRKVHSSLFCFSLLVLHEEKGHVAHKESKKQGGKSSREFRTYKTFSGRKRLLAICSFQVDLKFQLQLWNCDSLKTQSLAALCATERKEDR